MGTTNLKDIAGGFVSREFLIAAGFTAADFERAMEFGEQPILGAVVAVAFIVCRTIVKIKASANPLEKATHVVEAVGDVAETIRQSQSQNRQPMAQARRLPDDYQPLETMGDVREKIWSPEKL